MTSEAINLLLPGCCTYHICWRSSNNGYHIAYVDMPKTHYVTACDSYRDIMGVFHLQKKIRKFSIGNFRLGKARSICHKSHSREARPLNRPRKAWNW